MKQYASDIAFTDSVKAIQTRHGSRNSYARVEKNWWPDRITPELANFILERDSFYMATVNGEEQPYIQHRGGPKGFLKVLDERTLGFADFRGNRQYISYGNLEENNKVCLFLMDYPNQIRIKIWGTVEVSEDNQALINQLSVSSYKGKAERAFIIRVDTWDKNCPQHITPRYTIDEIRELDENQGRFD
jgi:predicted pyridoxine 5'-phosphate oxidase superfamily flavin-nucleotide-binding protein